MFMDDDVKTNCCNGYKSCEDREYDKNNIECSECVEDALRGIEQAIKDIFV